MDNQTFERAPLEARLDHLATTFYEKAWEEEVGAAHLREFLRDHASSLAEFARQVREEYARLSDGNGVTTNAQGIALARRITERTLYVVASRGGEGLDPEKYLLVRCHDRDTTHVFTCGIDREGSVSS